MNMQYYDTIENYLYTSLNFYTMDVAVIRTPLTYLFDSIYNIIKR